MAIHVGIDGGASRIGPARRGVAAEAVQDVVARSALHQHRGRIPHRVGQGGQGVVPRVPIEDAAAAEDVVASAAGDPVVASRPGDGVVCAAAAQMVGAVTGGEVEGLDIGQRRGRRAWVQREAEGRDRPWGVVQREIHLAVALREIAREDVGAAAAVEAEPLGLEESVAVDAERIVTRSGGDGQRLHAGKAERPPRSRVADCASAVAVQVVLEYDAQVLAHRRLIDAEGVGAAAAIHPTEQHVECEAVVARAGVEVQVRDLEVVQRHAGGRVADEPVGEGLRVPRDVGPSGDGVTRRGKIKVQGVVAAAPRDPAALCQTCEAASQAREVEDVVASPPVGIDPVDVLQRRPVGHDVASLTGLGEGQVGGCALVEAVPDVDVGAAVDGVDAAVAYRQIEAGAAVDDVGPGPSGQPVVAGAAIEDVVPAGDRDKVVPGARSDVQVLDVVHVQRIARRRVADVAATAAEGGAHVAARRRPVGIEGVDPAGAVDGRHAVAEDLVERVVARSAGQDRHLKDLPCASRARSGAWALQEPAGLCRAVLVTYGFVAAGVTTRTLYRSPAQRFLARSRSAPWP